MSQLIQDMAFTDHVALTAHSEDILQRLMNCLTHGYIKFGLSISLKKTAYSNRMLTTNQTSSWDISYLRWCTTLCILNPPFPLSSPRKLSSAGELEKLSM